MPGSVPIVIRTVNTVNGSPAAAVPTAALRDYFRAFDIDLLFRSGQPLREDPTNSPDSIEAFVAEHAPPVGTSGPAVLVVTDMGHLGALVNGMLLDAQRRGACAVFIQATGFTVGDAEARFEVFAHEIGHMLNLTHGDADGIFTTAMDSWDDRFIVPDRSRTWNDVIAAASDSFAQRLRGYFGTGNRQPLGLPMSEKCCDKLIAMPSPSVMPWLSPFHSNDPDDLQDVADSLLQCLLEIHGQAWMVAQPLDFTVTLSLIAGAAPMAVPGLLERTSEELLIQLMQPDGALRVLRPRQVSCTSTRRKVHPRQKIRRHDSLISDRNDLVFPIPGEYRVRALVPQTRSHSAWTTIDVAPAAGVFANPAMREFLKRGMPGDAAEAHWRKLDNIVADERVAPQVRADFASRAAGRGKRPFESLRQVRRAASPAVAERDALRRVAFLRRRGDLDDEALHRAIDHAERLFAAADAQHPTLGYLDYVRRKSLALPITERTSR